MARRIDKEKVQLSAEQQQISDPDTRPCFCNFMLPANLFYLQIPPDFRKQFLMKEKINLTSLRTPLGTWKVKLMIDDGDLYLKDGWPKFVKDHSLTDYEYLLFKYNGNMLFDVVVFEKNGLARNFQGNASSSNSTFPLFECTVKAHNVGSKSFLIIPVDFSRKYLKLTGPKMMILQNLEGILWTVNIILSAGDQHIISKGWKAFADANLLVKGDSCVFKLVKDDTMVVQIYRQS